MQSLTLFSKKMFKILIESALFFSASYSMHPLNRGSTLLFRKEQGHSCPQLDEEPRPEEFCKRARLQPCQ
jgi:hypothetical protein